MPRKTLSSTFPKRPQDAIDIAKDLQAGIENPNPASPQQALSEKNTIEYLKGLGYDWPQISKFLGKVP